MSQKFCTNCATAFVEGAAFCVSCGTPAQPGAAAQPAPPLATPPPPAFVAASVAPAPGYAPQPAYSGSPPAYPAAYPGAVPPASRPSAWTWRRWVLLAVGAVFLLGGLSQLGVFDRLRSTRVVGRWASDGRCLGATVLNANGSFEAPNGNSGRWTLSGDRLTLSGPDGSSNLRLASTTRNSLTVVGEDGTRETLVRC